MIAKTAPVDLRGEGAVELRREALHQAEVQDREPVDGQPKQITGMRVSMEGADLKHLLEVDVREELK